MKTLQIKLYSFAELSETAKEKAIDVARDRASDGYWDSVYEEIKALKDIAATIGANYKNIDSCFSLCGPSYITFDFEYDFPGSLANKRALTYIYNRFISPFMQGKYYHIGKWINGKYTYKSKHSKAIREFTSASGLYIDYTLLDVYKEYCDKLKNKENFSVQDFVEDMQDKLVTTILEAAEYADSNEAWRERLENDVDEIFTEDGHIF